jgi:hypothetical protein
MVCVLFVYMVCHVLESGREVLAVLFSWPQLTALGMHELFMWIMA